MQCPKCAHEMERVVYNDVEVDRCKLCKGLWFDSREHQILKAMDGSEAIDVGDPEVGELFNTEEKVKCPACHVDMIRMVDSEQPHIWYEGCSVCYGVFFDAGEFRDFKFHTLMDFIRAFRVRERK
ncbi:MAG: zf-TFIIB domain-containing protein [Gammaproteobacteria bacterium]|nr:MAG: zf-TFIIB domain-containing protein [Gammaproteobacteria bacterium]